MLSISGPTAFRQERRVVRCWSRPMASQAYHPLLGSLSDAGWATSDKGQQTTTLPPFHWGFGGPKIAQYIPEEDKTCP